MGERVNPNTGFELLEHTADAGVRAWGPSREEVFEATAQGMYALALSAPIQAGRQTLSFHVTGENSEDLLVHFLRELLFILDNRGLAATHFTFSFPKSGGLDAAGNFARIESEGRRREIKSPTYHQLSVGQADGEWTTEIYFDL